MSFTKSYERIALFFLSAAMIIFPAAQLLSRDISNGLYYGVAVLGVMAILTNTKPCGFSFKAFVQEHRVLAAVFSVLLVAIIMSQTGNGDIRFRYFDIPLRFALFPLIAFAFLSLRRRHFYFIQFGLISGAVLNLIAFCIETDFGAIRDNHTFRGLSLITFADCALWIGMLCLVTIFIPTQSKVLKVCRVLAFLAGLYVSITYETRGGWLVLPFFFLLMSYWFFCPLERLNKKKAMGIILGVMVALGVGISHPTVQSRLAEARADIALYVSDENQNTSVGLRLQMYEAVLRFAKEKPLFGAGLNKALYEVPELKAMVEKGMISDEALRKSHLHSDLFQYLFTNGVLGFLAILALYIAPMVYGFKANRKDQGKNPFARMGIVTGCSFFIFGLTEPLLIRDMLVNSYIMIMAVMVAYTIRARFEEEDVL